MKLIVASNEDFAKRLKKLNRDTEEEQKKFYSGDWEDISTNMILSDLTNNDGGVYEDMLNDIKEAIEKYGAPADDPETIETMREINMLLEYISNFI